MINQLLTSVEQLTGARKIILLILLFILSCGLAQVCDDSCLPLLAICFALIALFLAVNVIIETVCYYNEVLEC